MSTDTLPEEDPDRLGAVTEQRRTLSTTDLFGADREIAIDHDGTIYRLRITRQGKLILNK